MQAWKADVHEVGGIKAQTNQYSKQIVKISSVVLRSYQTSLAAAYSENK